MFAAPPPASSRPSGATSRLARAIAWLAAALALAVAPAAGAQGAGKAGAAGAAPHKRAATTTAKPARSGAAAQPKRAAGKPAHARPVHGKAAAAHHAHRKSAPGRTRLAQADTDAADSGRAPGRPVIASGRFAPDTHPQVRQFIDDLAAREGFDAAALATLFEQVAYRADVIRLMAPPPPGFKRSWQAYRARFLDPARVAEGARFMREQAEALRRATDTWGVPGEIVTAIIGVETFYGRITGEFRVIDALATLAFEYPRRAAYFREELEQFLLYARENRVDPLTVKGSFAGAIGLPQFMPGSIRRYAVDFDDDARIDLRASPSDAIGSVARFLASHGWVAGGPTRFDARIRPDANLEALVAAGVEPRFSVDELASFGVEPATPVPPDTRLALVDLPNGDAPTRYYLGAQNFYAITRYNRSSFYAMAVLEFADALAAAR